MQFFFVKKNVVIKQPCKTKCLWAATTKTISQNCVLADRVYCGFIAWEHLHAQEIIGTKNACLIDPKAINPKLLPYCIRSFNDAGNLISQLHPVLKTKQNQFSTRLALINGTGTMLGDTVVGAAVLINVANYLRSRGIAPEIDVYCAWNARPGVEGIWEQVPGIGKVYGSSLTIAELRQYDAFWDYSHLLLMEGYSSEHFGDFYFNHFGIDPTQVEPQLKLPSIRFNKQAFTDTKSKLIRHGEGKRLIFIQPEASTKARSMPEAFLVKLIKQLVRNDGCRLVIAGALPKGLSNFDRRQIINLQDFTKDNLDRYLSVIALSDYVISVDTLALHVAMGCNKPGVGLFALSEPSIRLKYSHQITGVLIPDAQTLPYWGKHKSDEHWEVHQASYETAWNQLSILQIVDKLS